MADCKANYPNIVALKDPESVVKYAGGTSSAIHMLATGMARTATMLRGFPRSGRGPFEVVRDKQSLNVVYGDIALTGGFLERLQAFDAAVAFGKGAFMVRGGSYIFLPFVSGVRGEEGLRAIDGQFVPTEYDKSEWKGLGAAVVNFVQAGGFGVESVVAVCAAARACLAVNTPVMFLELTEALNQADLSSLRHVSNEAPTAAGNLASAAASALCEALDFYGAVKEAKNFEKFSAAVSFLMSVPAFRLPFLRRGKAVYARGNGSILPPTKLADAPGDHFVVLRDARSSAREFDNVLEGDGSNFVFTPDTVTVQVDRNPARALAYKKCTVAELRELLAHLRDVKSRVHAGVTAAGGAKPEMPMGAHDEDMEEEAGELDDAVFFDE